MHVLQRHINANGATHGPVITRKVSNALENRWTNQVNQPATVACALLSLDADLRGITDEVQEEAPRFIAAAELCVSYLHSYHVFPDVAEDELEDRLLVQIAQFTGKTDRFQHLDKQIDTTKRSAGCEWSALVIWGLYSCDLCVVARALLGITASEAAVERTFSAQGAVHTKKRNLLHD
jgi:hypothetical protein